MYHLLTNASTRSYNAISQANSEVLPVAPSVFIVSSTVLILRTKY